MKKLLINSSIAALAVTCLPIAAQTETDTVKNDEQFETILVQGIRQSLKQASAEKLAADNIMEIINAEDIGKLPDDNLAEVLENISGVQITRSGGVGTGVSIRGIGRNNVEINGRATVPAGSQRGGISFEDLPSELISSVQVIKVPTADLIEGSVGGTVNLRTVAALDIKKPIRSVRIRYEYAENSGSYNPTFGVTSGGKTETSRGIFAGVISASYSDQEVREDNLRIVQSIRGNQDLDGDSTNDPYFRPAFSDSRFDFQNRKTFALSTNLAWQPDDDMRFFMDGTYSGFEGAFNTQSVFLGLPGARAELDNLDTATFESLNLPSSEQLQIMTSGRIDGYQLRPNTQVEERKTDTYTIGLGSEVYFGELKLTTDVAFSSSDSEQPRTTIVTQFQNAVDANGGGARQRVDFFYDARGSVFEFGPASDQNFDSEFLDPNRFSLFIVRDFLEEFTNDEFVARIDADWSLDYGPLSEFKFGVRYTDRTSERERYSVASRNFPGVFGSEITEQFSALPDDLFSFNSGGNYLGSILGLDGNRVLSSPESVISALAAASNNPDDFFTTPRVFDPAQAFEVQEQTFAAYLMGNLDFEVGEVPVTGNVGVRVVRTEQTAIGSLLAPNGSIDAPLNVSDDYNNVLPSLNLSVRATDSLVFRLGYAKNIRRPNFDELSSTTSFSLNGTPTNSGNSSLSPEIVDSLDLAIEYYFGEGSLVSLGYFQKDREGVISRVNTATPDLGSNDVNACSPGIFNPFAVFDTDPEGDPIGGCTDLIRPENADSGSVDGWEFAIQHSLAEHFDGFLGGFGFIGNVTIQDGERDFTFELPGTFDQNGEVVEYPVGINGLSETAYNATVFFEKYGINARVRYTYRDTFLIGESVADANGLPAYRDARGQVNASITYTINPTFKVTLAGVNLTKAIDEDRLAFENGPVFRVKDSDRRISIGLSAKF